MKTVQVIAEMIGEKVVIIITRRCRIWVNAWTAEIIQMVQGKTY